MADQTRDIEAETQAISDSIMSPYCPGRTLSACPSGQATELRSEIQGLLKQGYTETAVYNQLRVRFGETVTGVPGWSGVGLLGWFAPAIFIVLALIVVMRKLRTMRSVEAAAPQIEVPNQQMQSRVEAELKQRLVTRR